jgi:hypothetical protein
MDGDQNEIGESLADAVENAGFAGEKEPSTSTLEEPPVPVYLKMLDSLSGSIGHILFYVGIIGLIQAFVSRKVNREMKAAYNRARRSVLSRRSGGG